MNYDKVTMNVFGNLERRGNIEIGSVRYEG